MELSRQDKAALDKALYEAWASVGSICLLHDADSEYPPPTPQEDQIEAIVDRLFHTLTLDLCFYVVNMKESEFVQIIQSVAANKHTTFPASNGQTYPPALKKAV